LSKVIKTNAKDQHWIATWQALTKITMKNLKLRLFSVQHVN